MAVKLEEKPGDTLLWLSESVVLYNEILTLTLLELKNINQLLQTGIEVKQGILYLVLQVVKFTLVRNIIPWATRDTFCKLETNICYFLDSSLKE